MAKTECSNFSSFFIEGYDANVNEDFNQHQRRRYQNRDRVIKLYSAGSGGSACRNAAESLDLHPTMRRGSTRGRSTERSAAQCLLVRILFLRITAGTFLVSKMS